MVFQSFGHLDKYFNYQRLIKFQYFLSLSYIFKYKSTRHTITLFLYLMSCKADATFKWSSVSRALERKAIAVAAGLPVMKCWICRNVVEITAKHTLQNHLETRETTFITHFHSDKKKSLHTSYCSVHSYLLMQSHSMTDKIQHRMYWIQNAREYKLKDKNT